MTCSICLQTTDVKLTGCNVCNKTFKDKGTLTNHQLIHGGVGPYVCEVCSLAYSKKFNLITHQRILVTALMPVQYVIRRSVIRTV
jgi:uncharacterized Zn-finger protein